MYRAVFDRVDIDGGGAVASAKYCSFDLHVCLLSM